ncbi:hypothetical protein JTB14_007372 [Gonioctena quinquepunctata]|nr:hypothetical protein JTB14_007372 [Gonioctena quinquepunctata]
MTNKEGEQIQQQFVYRGRNPEAVIDYLPTILCCAINTADQLDGRTRKRDGRVDGERGAVPDQLPYPISPEDLSSTAPQSIASLGRKRVFAPESHQSCIVGTKEQTKLLFR